MRNILDKIWTKIVFFIYEEQRRKAHLFNKMIIAKDANIKLGKNVSIAGDAKVETRLGGAIEIGNNTRIHDGVLILSYGGTLVIGDNCDINAYSVIYGVGGLIIGNNVLIAGHTMIIPASHTFSDKHQTIIEQGITAKGIKIEDDVWIAHGCSILDGITIGKGAVIAAGSVVNKDVDSYSVFAGAPVKKIKDR